MKILGSVLGAVSAAVILVLVFLLLYRAPRENWDHGSPMMVMIAIAYLLPVGAIAGYLIAGALQAGRNGSALKFAGIAAVLSALPAIYIVAYPYLPQRAPKAANERERVEWAKSPGIVSADFGWSLASSLEKCLREWPGEPMTDRLVMRTPDCQRLRSVWYGAGPDSIAAAPHYRYKVGDDGWRWELAPEGERRAIVFPDPLLEQEGPIFEALPWRILRRETRTSPAFITNRHLADIEHSRACIAKRAAILKASGEWDGDGATLPALLATPETILAGCPRVEVNTRRKVRVGEIALKLSGMNLHTTYEVIHQPVEGGGYEWSFRGQPHSYLIDSAGAWHVSSGSFASVNDPPPEPCLLDLTIPCE